MLRGNDALQAKLVGRFLLPKSGTLKRSPILIVVIDPPPMSFHRFQLDLLTNRRLRLGFFSQSVNFILLYDTSS